MAHNRDMYPEIWAAKEKAEAKLAPLMEKRAKCMAKMNIVAEEMQALRAKKVAHHDDACVDWDQIYALKKEIGRLARAMGGLAA